ncbi:hypothetical protein ISU07_01975 [Nocardioides islandensis]|uniref:Allene oxide cyclase barrel-like domain-containing protein n=1 Tax=Nocardioides islandensis TaxID=433663 RepID=A0A930V8H8_9ACTN|nr:hypothetical protein [Nocardioides islandensis]MBF4761882.1 hypothetical protein [Nocardioides islandensis]
MFSTLARTLLVTGTVAAATLVAGSASASVTNTRSEVHFAPADAVVATCADGSEIGLGFDIVRNIHDTYDDDGTLLQESRNVNFTGIFENLSTGEQYVFQGTRIVTFDFVAGTLFGRGNYRTVTLPHAGVVLHAAGMQVIDLETGLLMESAGAAIDEWVAGPGAVCSLFGLEGP